jgi:hypothetical protein
MSIRVFILATLFSFSAFATDVSMDLCHPVVNGVRTTVATKIVTASDLLPITPQNFASYKKSVITMGRKYQSQDAPPLELGKRYEVSPQLPKFMLYRISTDGIYELRGFSADSRFFREQIINGKIEWTGVPAPKSVTWKRDLGLESNPPAIPKVDYSRMNREDLIKKIAANTGEASRTVQDTNPTSSPERAKAAAEGLTKAADYILTMIDKKQGFTIDKLEELHATVANGTIQTPNGDLGLGMLRGSSPRCAKSGNSYVIADMSHTSVRMGEQKIISYTAPQDVRKTIQSLLNRINAVNSSTPASEIADIYAQFLETHPFIDGNGRTSRMLLQYMQIKMQAPISRLNEKAAFMAFYLKPTELSNVIFESSSSPAKTSPLHDNASPGAH